MNSDHQYETDYGGHLPSWAGTAIALVRQREAGDEITDEDVLEECAFAGVDPTPVMILAQRKAPAAWPAIIEEPKGRRIVGQRLLGLWFDLEGRHFVIVDTPEAQEALEILMEITGIPAPRMHPLAPFRWAIHPSEIPEWGEGPTTRLNRARGKVKKKSRRRRRS